MERYKPFAAILIGFSIGGFWVGRVILAIALQMQAPHTPADDPTIVMLTGMGMVLCLFSYAQFVIGCSYFARSKGRSAVSGAALGCLMLLGLIILAVLPRKPSRVTA